MNTDLRISTSLVSHPKVKKVMRMLGSDAFYSLISLWSYTATNKPDGTLNNLDVLDIAIASNWEGDPDLFFDAMCQVGFLDCKNDVITVHDWAKHNPWAAGAEDRSNRSRFNKLKSHYPDLYEKLYEEGTRLLDADEYQAAVKEHLSTTQAPLKRRSSPTPTPTPTPTPLDISVEDASDPLQGDIEEEPKAKLPDKNEAYRPVAENLKDIVLLRRKRKIDNKALSSWANTLRLMVETDGIEVERITQSLDWYRDHWMDDYVPVIESAKTLREKFGKIEDAITRSTRDPTKTVSMKHAVNDQIQDIGARINEQTGFNPYRVLEGGDGGKHADQDRRALPE